VARKVPRHVAEAVFEMGGGQVMPDPLSRLRRSTSAEINRRFVPRPDDQRPASRNHAQPGTTVGAERPDDEQGVGTADTPSGQEEPDIRTADVCPIEPAHATATIAAWCAALDLRVVDNVVVVHLDGHEPAPVTPAVLAAAYLDGMVDAEHGGTYTDAIERARARLAVADLDAALRGPVERTLARERIAVQRRRRLAAEAAEQARLRAALVAALAEARAARP